MTYFIFIAIFLVTFLAGYSVGCGVTKFRTLRILVREALIHREARQARYNEGVTYGIRIAHAAQLARKLKMKALA